MKEDHDSTRTLIRRFIERSNGQQLSGYLCIGITTKFPYVKNYGIQDLISLNGGEAFATNNGYEFIACSEEYCQRLLSHGYRHETLHDVLLAYHVTLIFRKIVTLNEG
jgi:hypothetical protein